MIDIYIKLFNTKFYLLHLLYYNYLNNFIFWLRNYEVL
jgi:hypothetical protein